MIKITHNAGFFLKCLSQIGKYYMITHQKYPQHVDTSESWHIYRPSNCYEDITYHFLNLKI